VVSRAALRQVTVVHRGARDAYEVAAALADAGLLHRLVTDLYWPADRAWAAGLERILPERLVRALQRRFHPRVSSKLVHQTPVSGLTSFLLEKIEAVPFGLRRSAVRATDAHLGRTAGRLAAGAGSLLLSYSYYGYHAFRSYGGPGILFQLHPHPLSVRRILQQELRDHPEWAESLEKEWELSLPADDFETLVKETRLANSFLVASSFTRQTLIENGAPPESIRVIPYGVDLARFTPGTCMTSAEAPLRLLFVGTVTQRKGIGYLLEALRLAGRTNVELTICGRTAGNRTLFEPFRDRVYIREFVSPAELQAAYRTADLFVLPSLAEGFAHVLLEALASGLPVLSTTHTAAPDLIEEGVHGFVVEPRRSDLLAERIEWAFTHRAELARMRGAARKRAEEFSWQRFREAIAGTVGAWIAKG
jgi:glycosyltransferase involved in cell wall biosynthesis